MVSARRRAWRMRAKRRAMKKRGGQIWQEIYYMRIRPTCRKNYTTVMPTNAHCQAPSRPHTLLTSFSPPPFSPFFLPFSMASLLTETEGSAVWKIGGQWLFSFPKQILSPLMIFYCGIDQLGNDFIVIEYGLINYIQNLSCSTPSVLQTSLLSRSRGEGFRRKGRSWRRCEVWVYYGKCRLNHYNYLEKNVLFKESVTHSLPSLYQSLFSPPPRCRHYSQIITALHHQIINSPSQLVCLGEKVEGRKTLVERSGLEG